MDALLASLSAVLVVSVLPEKKVDLAEKTSGVVPKKFTSIPPQFELNSIG